MAESLLCGDCAVAVGEPHDENCDVARCLATGAQRLSCDGHDEGWPYTWHDCGRDVWTGRWPGDAEAEEFGWFVQDRCAEGLGWVRCGPNAHGAQPDLNRLKLQARWSREQQRWVLR